ncbi:MAG: malto-oligosyltrehalose trehalohydrolase, partial [Actinobacteria bacterium]|nr:malto-oligosyltrehalose trehalohydrolase [Actinomycetota bacterium]
MWAPLATEVRIAVVDGDEFELLAEPGRDGWFQGPVDLPHGSDYWVRIDGTSFPDPLARWLPNGVHEAARFWDHATTVWTDQAWRGRSLRDAGCIYELHVGTFTEHGTLDAALERLDWLVDLGVTHIELMPLAAFDGERGWGYDGVALNAVQHSYGGPDALCRFVDACHGRGLAVLLDVVHNHLGPSGNYWDAFGPLSTEKHRTPWGGAINLDDVGSDDVRAILIDTTLGWLRDFHLDGLRMDAVHELVDDRALTYLEELGEAVRLEAARLDRIIEVTAESDRNDARTVTSVDDGGLGLTAQWDDDIHHALHWLITGEEVGYYGDFATAQAVSYALERGFLHDGTWSSFRGRSHGRPVDFSLVGPWRFIISVQTHDQVGNRATGERLSHLVDLDTQAAAATILLTLPYTPMLFMGQEWGAETPWQFFTDFADPELGRLVTEGRRSEFDSHGWAAQDVPDPQSEGTFRRSVLQWSQAESHGGSQLADWYRTLLRLRRDNPGLASAVAQADGAGEIRTAAGLRVAITTNEAGQPESIMLTRD